MLFNWLLSGLVFSWSQLRDGEQGADGESGVLWRSALLLEEGKEAAGARPGHSSDEGLGQPHGELGRCAAPGSPDGLSGSRASQAHANESLSNVFIYKYIYIYTQ